MNVHLGYENRASGFSGMSGAAGMDDIFDEILRRAAEQSAKREARARAEQEAREQAEREAKAAAEAKRRRIRQRIRNHFESRKEKIERPVSWLNKFGFVKEELKSYSPRHDFDYDTFKALKRNPHDNHRAYEEANALLNKKHPLFDLAAQAWEAEKKHINLQRFYWASKMQEQNVAHQKRQRIHAVLMEIALAGAEQPSRGDYYSKWEREGQQADQELQAIKKLDANMKSAFGTDWQSKVFADDAPLAKFQKIAREAQSKASRKGPTEEAAKILAMLHDIVADQTQPLKSQLSKIEDACYHLARLKPPKFPFFQRKKAKQVAELRDLGTSVDKVSRILRHNAATVEMLLGSGSASSRGRSAIEALPTIEHIDFGREQSSLQDFIASRLRGMDSLADLRFNPRAGIIQQERFEDIFKRNDVSAKDIEESKMDFPEDLHPFMDAVVRSQGGKRPLNVSIFQDMQQVHSSLRFHSSRLSQQHQRGQDVLQRRMDACGLEKARDTSFAYSALGAFAQVAAIAHGCKYFPYVSEKDAAQLSEMERLFREHRPANVADAWEANRWHIDNASKISGACRFLQNADLELSLQQEIERCREACSKLERTMAGHTPSGPAGKTPLNFIKKKLDRSANM